MARKIRKLTPDLLQRIIKEEKTLLESLGIIKKRKERKNTKTSKKLMEVRKKGKKLKKLKKAQTKIALLFKKIVEERNKITHQLKKEKE